MNGLISTEAKEKLTSFRADADLVRVASTAVSCTSEYSWKGALAEIRCYLEVISVLHRILLEIRGFHWLEVRQQGQLETSKHRSPSALDLHAMA